MKRRSRVPRNRAGAAAVELALLLPFLAFIFVILADFSRVFYFSQIVANCARNGAVYESKLVTADSPYASLSEAALADAPDLSPAPAVSSTSGTDADGNPYVRVTVTWDFHTITQFPGIPSTVKLTRTSQMRITQ